jgi:hypothetical protein
MLLIKKAVSNFIVFMHSAPLKVSFCQPATQLIHFRFTDHFAYLEYSMSPYVSSIGSIIHIKTIYICCYVLVYAYCNLFSVV